MQPFDLYIILYESCNKNADRGSLVIDDGEVQAHYLLGCNHQC